MKLTTLDLFSVRFSSDEVEYFAAESAAKGFALACSPEIKDAHTYSRVERFSRFESLGRVTFDLEAIEANRGRDREKG